MLSNQSRLRLQLGKVWSVLWAHVSFRDLIDPTTQDWYPCHFLLNLCS
jgi:hypothetical protein